MLKKDQFVSINPETGKEIFKIDSWTPNKINNELEASIKDFEIWKNKSITFRLNQIKSIKTGLETHLPRLAEIITKEVGKPISQSISEIEKCISLCNYYLNISESVLKDKVIEESPFRFAQIHYSPLGGILGIMPWNFPFWQVFRFALPALISGNVVWLKHAPNVSLCNIEIEKLFNSNLNFKIYRSVFIDIQHIESVVAHPHIQGTSLTGSENAGSSLASLSGKHIKKTLLELGGNDAFLICNDANIEKAAKMAITSRMINSGQTCISTKRVYIPQKEEEKVISFLKQEMALYTKGELNNNLTKIGPMARPDLADGLKKQLDKLESLNFSLIDQVGEDDGLFLAPRLYLADNLTLFDEELFGPVLIIYVYNELDEAIRAINDSRFGLGVSIWTENEEKALKLSKTIEVGSVAINNMVQSNMNLPFGGIKKSGFGRELGQNSLLEFVNHKVIYA